MAKITEQQLSGMQHAIGYTERRVRGRKHRSYYAYRNHYASYGYLVYWDELVRAGLATCERQPDNVMVLYHVTEAGLAALSEVLGVAITEED